jgi:hypothetical protein
MKKILFAITVSVYLTACAGISKESLKPVTVDSSVVFEKKISQTDEIDWTDGFMPGTYKAIGVDKKGTYYMGPHFGRIEYGGGQEDRRCDGGFFVPFDKTKSMKYFFVMSLCISGKRADYLAQHPEAADENERQAGLGVSTGTIGVNGGGAVGAVGVGLGVGITNSLIAAEQDKIFVTRDITDPRIIEIIKSQLKD